MNNWPMHYRYDAHQDEGGVTHIHLTQFVVVHETPCTYQVVPDWAANYDPKWRKSYQKRVCKGSDRGHALPNRDLAWVSFQARQRFRLRHAEYQRRIASAALDYVGTVSAPPVKSVTLDRGESERFSL